MGKGKVEIHSNINSAMQKKQGFAPTAGKPILKKMNGSLFISAKADGVNEALAALNKLHINFGASHLHECRVVSTPVFDKIPVPALAFTANNTADTQTFKDIMDVFKANKDRLSKAWFMTGAERMMANIGSWKHEVSFTRDKLSFEGSVQPMKSLDEILQAIDARASKEFKEASYEAMKTQWGILINSFSKGLVKFEASSSRKPYRNKDGVYEYVAKGLLNSNELMQYLETLMFKNEGGVEEIDLYGFTIWGFERGIEIRKCEKDSGYIITMELDTTEGKLHDNVTAGIVNALA